MINPGTGNPVDKRAVYVVFKERCYDDPEDPDNTWSNRPRLSRKAITEEVRIKRAEWATWMLGLRHTGAWYYNNLVWTDICNSVLPRTEKKAAEQALSRKNGKAWMSDGFRRDDKNLRGDKRGEDEQLGHAKSLVGPCVGAWEVVCGNAATRFPRRPP